MQWIPPLLMRYGYGVHSPFAYKLIREVLYPVGYAYYDEIGLRCLDALAFRVAVAFPLKVDGLRIGSGAEFDLLRRALHAVDLRSTDAPDPLRPAYTCSLYESGSLRERFSAPLEPYHLELSTDSLRKSLFQKKIETSGGAVFHMPGVSLMVLNPKLYPRVYTLR